MKKIIILLIGLILTGCAQSNYASKKTVISNMTDFVKINESVCGQFKSSEKKLLFDISESPVNDIFSPILFDIKYAPQYSISQTILFGIDYAPN